MHQLLGRRVTNEFEEFVAENHLPRREREVFADGKRALVGHRDVAGFNVVLEILKAVLEALAVGLNRALNGFRVG